MHIISRKAIIEFGETHPTAQPGLAQWYSLMKMGTFQNLAELREVFPSADLVGRVIVFNIGGNSFRLVAAMHFNRQKVYIRAIMTHNDYDKGNWKE